MVALPAVIIWLYFFEDVCLRLFLCECSDQVIFLFLMLRDA